MNDTQKTLECFHCTHGRPHPEGSPCGMANPLKEKGRQGSECNRTACTNVPATWYNLYTQAWYCEPCARRINTVASPKVICERR